MNALTAPLACCALLACSAPIDPKGYPDTLDVAGTVSSNGTVAIPTVAQVRLVWNTYVGEGGQHGQKFLQGEGYSENGFFELQLEDTPPDLLLQADGVARGYVYLFAAEATLPDYLESPEGQPADWLEPTLDAYLQGIAHEVSVVFRSPGSNSKQFANLAKGYSCIQWSDAGAPEQTSCDDIVIETTER